MRVQSIVLWTALMLGPFVPADAQLKVGSAAVKITPPPGTPMAGYYFTRFAEGVHDDLYSKAIVLESGGTTVALVSLDLITTSRDLVEAARTEIERSTKIPGANVMIGATHAHTGPVITNRSSRDIALGGAGEAAKKYNAELPKLIALSVQQAFEKRTESMISAGMGRVEQLAFNRRFHMKDGTVGWNPGKLNANILRPAGPTDPEVGVLAFAGVDKTLQALYVNFAMHLDTVGGTKISADYPHFLSRHLAEAKGGQLLTLFATGCCGNINHIDVGWGERQSSPAEAFRIGTVLAAEVLKALSRTASIVPGPLRIRSQLVELPVPPVSDEAVAKAEETLTKLDQKPAPPFLEQVNAFKTVDVAAKKGSPYSVEVQVISFGTDVAWISLPGEIFVELGLAIKAASPFKHTFIAELANGSIGYIPDRKAYVEGNYEVVSSRVAAGSGELLVDAAARMLRELYKEAASPK